MKTFMNVRLKRGVNVPISYRLLQSEQPIDLTGVEFSASIKTHRGVLVAKLLVTSPEPLNGIFEVRPSNSEDWPIGIHQWDVDLVFPSGDKLSLPMDSPAVWEVVEDVTREND